jgi:heme oxygenase
VAYVLEGSTLGGAVLLERVAPLGVTAARGGSFLASYGAERARMWHAFLHTLSMWDERGVSHDAVVHAACETFELARRAL